MLSKRFVVLEYYLLNDIKQNMYAIRCDFKNKKILRMRKKIILYDIKRIFNCEIKSEEYVNDYKQLNQLKEFIKRYKVKYDGRYMRGEFPEGYEGMGI